MSVGKRLALVALVAGVVAVGTTVWLTGARALPPLTVHVAPPLRLPVVASFRSYIYDLHSADLARLIPARAHARRVWAVHRKGFHDMILVEWMERQGRASHRHASPEPFRWGLRLWTSSPPTPSHVFDGPLWRAVDLPIVESAAPTVRSIHIEFRDVTGDRRPDVLFEQDPGANHRCGPHQVFSTSPGGMTTRAFSSSLCGTTLHGEHGLLALTMPYYLRPHEFSHPAYFEYLRLRWDGRRYVVASMRIA